MPLTRSLLIFNVLKLISGRRVYGSHVQPMLSRIPARQYTSFCAYAAKVICTLHLIGLRFQTLSKMVVGGLHVV